MFDRAVIVVSLAVLAGCGRFDFEVSSDDMSTEGGDSNTAGDAGNTEPVVSGEEPDAPGDWVQLSAGVFTMGSPESEPCRGGNETQHQVTLSQGFWIQDTEVTQAQFLEVMGYNPSGFPACGDDCPVETVNWHESAAYCNELSLREGLTPCYTCTGAGPSVTCIEGDGYEGAAVYDCEGYRLPTEAEWEYAYRAGTTTSYYSGPGDDADCAVQASADSIGWYANTASTSQPVAQKAPNEWGVYDMAGNVWEWCHDQKMGELGSEPVVDPVGVGNETSRVIRGGGWWGDADLMRAAHRFAMTSTLRGGTDGVRCVRTR